MPQSQWQVEHGFRRAKRPYTLLGVARERAELDARIRARAAQMLAAGLVSEVVGLCQRGYAEARAMSAVGYREVCAAIAAGAVDQSALLEDIVRKTRTFA
jgi:tRNA dimethylallyltransferase